MNRNHRYRRAVQDIRTVHAAHEAHVAPETVETDVVSDDFSHSVDDTVNVK